MDVSLVLAFGGLLIVATLLSERARTTVLSTSVLFVVGGLLLGSGWLPWARIEPSGAVLAEIAKIALFTVLIVDGAELDVRAIANAWKLPGRALLLGLPLTIAAIALAAHLLLDTGWRVSVLLGAVLSPTDPVMIRTILAHGAVPLRLRRLLSIESGLNDGLALPPIVLLLAMLGDPAAHPLAALAEGGAGIAVGVIVALVALLDRTRWASLSTAYQPLLGVGIAVSVFAICDLTDANELLAAFAAGVTLATARGNLAKSFRSVGEPLSEAVKLGTLLVFGATLSLDLDVPALVFAAIVLIAARPTAILLAFLGNGLPRHEWVVAAWFGPKGFASLLYASLVLASGIPRAAELYKVVGLVVVVSIVVHSSTDSLVARMFASRQKAKEADDGGDDHAATVGRNAPAAPEAQKSRPT